QFYLALICQKQLRKLRLSSEKIVSPILRCLLDMIKSLKYIDIHAHLNFPDFDSDREGLISTMARDGIGAINVGTSLPTSRSVLALAENHPHLWSVVGIHPHEAE